MPHTLVIGAAKITDGRGTLDSCLQLVDRIQKTGSSVRNLWIEPLRSGWNTPLQEDHFRSGCAPVQALNQAVALIDRQQESAVMINGDDYLRSQYTPDDRRRMMAIYGHSPSLMEAYNNLAHRFLEKQGADETSFHEIARVLFTNYLNRYNGLLQRGEAFHNVPAENRYQYVTDLFRYVDCANPVVDFQGRLLLASSELADELCIEDSNRIAVGGTGITELASDGPDAIEEISAYDHLDSAWMKCRKQLGADFRTQFLNGRALLEAYTCYPVVPMALLLSMGLVKSIREIPDLLAKHAVTVTGGMNLARAPWNNPALNGLISMYQRLSNGEGVMGAVHGNGGLGYSQGVAVLIRPSVLSSG